MRQSDFDRDGNLSPEQFAVFVAESSPRSYERRGLLLREGEVCRGIHCVEAGAVGRYHLSDGRMLFEDFYFPGDFASDMKSLTSGVPATTHLLALEPTETRYIRKETLLGLYEVDAAYQTFGRAVLERLVVDRSDQLRRLTSLSPDDRYRSVLSEEPELVRRVPVQYLASYLGVTRETLSRVRGRV